MILNQTRTVARKTQHRVISHYLQDVWRTGSWSPTNPLLKWLEDNHALPSSAMQPYHVSSALAHIQQEAAVMDPSQLHQVDAVQGKFDALQQIASLFWLTSSNPKWREALETIHKNRIFSKEQEQVIYTSFQKLTTDEEEEEEHRAVHRWVREYEQRTGEHLSHREEYQMLCEALEELEAKFQAAPKTLTPAQSQQTMGDMYNYLGIQGRLAELLGYQHYAERIFENRMANIEQVHKLHEQVAAAVLPIVTKGLTQYAALDDYLSSTKKHPAHEDDPLRKDKAIMLRLEHHVTLEGTLEFIKKLSSELFGFSLVEEELVAGATWDKDVRLFHVMDDQRKFGSFLFDPYDRSGKSSQPFTASLINRSVDRLPLAVLSMALEPPAWDTESTPMTWQHVETLLHEMAHVYHLLSAQSVMGTLLDAQHLTLDLSELLPKYMEHWMTEPSTIYTLLMLSKPSQEIGFENEEEMKEAIEAAIRVRSNDKAFQLAQLCFFGELELSLFSSFDIRGDELLIHFQNRLAEKWSPHDLPDKRDITPLLRIFRENADGRPVAWYRYLWCDALSASVFQRSKDIYASKEDGNPLREMMRKTILEPGIMIEPAEVLSVFGIDEVSPDALLKLYNL